uniref:Uncharacterized protein n=1 Tax=Ascaris lumbricoides TaxID=6252 RepID=A0A9J2PZU7_ASCLU
MEKCSRRADGICVSKFNCVHPIIHFGCMKSSGSYDKTGDYHESYLEETAAQTIADEMISVADDDELFSERSRPTFHAAHSYSLLADNSQTTNVMVQVSADNLPNSDTSIGSSNVLKVFSLIMILCT